MFTKYSNFVLTFGHVAKRLDSKEKLILKFMTSQSGKQVIAINILPNILRSKDKETMKFGQLIKYNLRNIFNVVEKLFRDPFLQNEMEHISGSIA